MQHWQVAGFGLYVHWPFCQAKCPYCDFNSHVAGTFDQESWLAAYVSEIERHAKETPGRVLRSLFFGGGTPSLMKPETVEGIINAAAKHWTFANDIEITLEANPTSVEAKKFEGFRAAGVNRVSIGVQALNDTDLRRLGRLHSAREALVAIEAAQATFDRSSFDLIYARQDQSMADWESELRQALQIADGHLSLYQLTIEAGTVFGARQDLGKLHGLPGEDLSADMFVLTQDLCEEAGMPAYEVSNHAKSGAESRHNMIYWNCGDYLGIGPGAHGRITAADGGRSATVCPKMPGEWKSMVETGGAGENLREVLSREDQAAEFLLMGLRVSGGIDLEQFSAISGGALNPVKVQELVESGHVTLNDHMLKSTRKGVLLLNRVIDHLSG